MNSYRHRARLPATVVTYLYLLALGDYAAQTRLLVLQRQLCQVLARALQGEIVAEYLDIEGSPTDRRRRTAMFGRLRRRQDVGYVLVAEPDLLTLSIPNRERMQRLIEDRGAKLVTAREAATDPKLAALLAPLMAELDHWYATELRLLYGDRTRKEAAA